MAPPEGANHIPIDLTKWGRTPDIEQELDEKTVNTWILCRIDMYEECKYGDKWLWEEFQDDFDGWAEGTFKIGHKDALKRLRNHLLSWGVLCKRKPRYSVAKALVDVLKEETPKEWPEDRIQELLESGELRSNGLKRRAGLLERVLIRPQITVYTPFQPQIRFQPQINRQPDPQPQINPQLDPQPQIDLQPEPLPQIDQPQPQLPRIDDETSTPTGQLQPGLTTPPDTTRDSLQQDYSQNQVQNRLDESAKASQGQEPNTESQPSQLFLNINANQNNQAAGFGRTHTQPGSTPGLQAFQGRNTWNQLSQPPGRFPKLPENG